jgi:hypothetical protein
MAKQKKRKTYKSNRKIAQNKKRKQNHGMCERE